MTKEESKIMWEMEKRLTDMNQLRPSLKKLYEVVDKLIEDDVLTYDVFVENLTAALISTTIVDSEDTHKVRMENIDNVCLQLIEQYEQLNTKEYVEDTDR